MRNFTTQQIGGRSEEITIRFAGSENEIMKGGKAGRGAYIRGKLGDNTMNVNFKSMAKVGLAIRQGRMANEMLGAYTNDRLFQRRVNMAMQFGTYAIGIAKFGVFGALYAGGDMAYRVGMHQIDLNKKNREARHMREITGIANRSNSRHDGGML